MTRSYRLTPEARTNVDEIGAFTAEDNVDAAVRVLEAQRPRVKPLRRTA